MTCNVLMGNGKLYSLTSSIGGPWADFFSIAAYCYNRLWFNEIAHDGPIAQISII